LVTSELVPAHPAKRLLAFIIDLSILAIVGSFLRNAFLIVGLPQSILQVFSFAPIGWLYYVFFTAEYGQTLGKKVVGIRVVSVDGADLNWIQVILRETIGKILSTIALLLGFVWIFIDKDNRAWHDKIAGTSVIDQHESVK